MKRLVAFAISYFLSLSAGGTTLPPIALDQLFRDADVVASVQVVSGELLGVGEASCGAKYSALVLDGFKGVTAGTTIEFGNYFGYEIGNQYILFLVRPGRTHEPMMSTNSMHLNARAEHLKRCGQKLLRNTVMHSGNGALKIHWVAELKYKDGVAIPTRYVTLPAGLSTVPAKVTETNEFSGEVWVALPEFSKVLRELGK